MSCVVVAALAFAACLLMQETGSKGAAAAPRPALSGATK